ncbi:MAG: tetratricopeptide repeat protein [Sandaracinaceae bacterium]|nr:tetratricopeptide repeat protein [Sandaracinaceae bacterium]
MQPSLFWDDGKQCIQSMVQAESRPCVLLAGPNDPIESALRLALERRGLAVRLLQGDLLFALRSMTPDLLVLFGKLAEEGGQNTLERLARDPIASSVPVAVISNPDALEAKILAFRKGATAVIPRQASVDGLASQIAELARQSAQSAKTPSAFEQIGEATFDELLQAIGRELQSGILSVEPKHKGKPLRIVLGAGRSVAEVVEEFVRKLRPHISQAEPLVYELHRGLGEVLALDGEGEAEAHADLSIYQGLRILLIERDPGHADAMADFLREKGAKVVIIGPSGAGIERARALDPELILVDAQLLESEAFHLIRRLRRDVRLRWAPLVVLPAQVGGGGLVDPAGFARLAEEIRVHLLPERHLKESLERDATAELRLETMGIARLLRLLGKLPYPSRISIRRPEERADFEVAEGLLVSACAESKAGSSEGLSALSIALRWASGRVRIEFQSQARSANIMLPIEEALAQAESELSPPDPSELSAPHHLPSISTSSSPITLPTPKVPAPPELLDNLRKPTSPESAHPPISVKEQEELGSSPIDQPNERPTAPMPSESLRLDESEETTRSSSFPIGPITVTIRDHKPEQTKEVKTEDLPQQPHHSPFFVLGAYLSFAFSFLALVIAIGSVVHSSHKSASSKTSPKEAQPAESRSQEKQPSSPPAQSTPGAIPSAENHPGSPFQAPPSPGPIPMPSESNQANPTPPPTDSSLPPPPAPSALSSSPRDHARALLERAEETPNEDARERIYRRVLEIDPHEHHAMIGLAQLLLRRGRGQEALPLIEGALRKRPKRPEYHLLFGDALAQAGEIERARAAWSRALELAPHLQKARMRLERGGSN